MTVIAYYHQAAAIHPTKAPFTLPTVLAVFTNLDWTSNWLNKVRHTHSQVSSSNRWFRRCRQVVGDPYSCAETAQAHLVFNTSKKLFDVWRSSVHVVHDQISTSE
jgi:hypothetical protein